MSTINITLPDGSKKELPEGANAHDLAMSISEGLARNIVAAKINDELADVHISLKDGDSVVLLKKDDPESILVMRHSAAHIMAQAVQNLFPGAKTGTGPNVEHGFYYDFDIPDHQLTPDDLEKIEAEMRRIIKEKQKFQRRRIEDVDGTIKAWNDKGDIYKAEILEKYKDNDPTIYFCVSKDGSEDVWSDLCEGPHLPDTSWIKAIKLMSVAGAYWRGDEKNAQMQRVYATAFFSKDDLEAHLQWLEEAEKRDHRKIGKEHHLFSVENEIGPGLILWHPKLGTVREELEGYLKKQLRRRGYEMVYTPHLAKRDLWEISGHTSHYLENMFTMDIEGQDYILKPMNCPMHVMIYKSQIRSYRDLPIRLGELGTVYRYERSGTMHGLTRVRGFTQDDAHLFCRIDQITEEIKDVINFVDHILGLFDMSFNVKLSTRPEKFVGDREVWDEAEAALKKALEEYGLEYEINEGDGAFYGPKIDFELKDAINRIWQCSTIQLDFNLPQRFELKYTDSDGQPKQPIMIHRAIFGSLERFAAILIEHFSGAFPVWLAPTQVSILTIADRHLDAAKEIQKKLLAEDVRVELDASNESVNYKVRNGQLEKIPYMLVIGDKEVESGQVAVRSRSGGNLGAIPVDEFMSKLQKEIDTLGKERPLEPDAAGDAQPKETVSST